MNFSISFTTLKLRKDEFEEIKELAEKRIPLYTLTKSKELIRVYEVYRGRTKIDGIILKSDGEKVSETTCREFIKLWNAEEAEDADFSEIKKIIDRMDEHFQKEILEKRRGMRAQGGFIGGLMAFLKEVKMLGKVVESNVDEEKLEALIGYLPYVEMHSQDISKFKKFLLENGCIDEKGRVKDLAKLVDKSYEYLKAGRDRGEKVRLYGFRVVVLMTTISYDGLIKSLKKNFDEVSEGEFVVVREDVWG